MTVASLPVTESLLEEAGSGPKSCVSGPQAITLAVPGRPGGGGRVGRVDNWLPHTKLGALQSLEGAAGKD